MIEFPESITYNQAHFAIYKKANGLESIDIPVTHGATSAQILILDLTFSARNYFNFGGLRQYYTLPGMNTEVVLHRFGKVPIQEIFIQELSPSNRSFLRFYPDYWLFEFSLDISFNS